MSYYVFRRSLNARSEEDQAMAFKSAGPYDDLLSARLGLEDMVRREIKDWQEFNRGPAYPWVFEQIEKLTIAADEVAAGATEVVIDGLVFKIV